MKTFIFEGNSQVQSDESDAGDCLHSFAANEKYWDWRNNNNQFDDEFIYIDKDGNNIVSIGDQRLTQVRVRVAGGVRVYSPGSFVEAGNADIGANYVWNINGNPYGCWRSCSFLVSVSMAHSFRSQGLDSKESRPKENIA